MNQHFYFDLHGSEPSAYANCNAHSKADEQVVSFPGVRNNTVRNTADMNQCKMGSNLWYQWTVFFNSAHDPVCFVTDHHRRHRRSFSQYRAVNYKNKKKIML